ncbi:12643_t:CDS:2, partial [Ambispora leptoticha]
MDQHVNQFLTVITAIARVTSTIAGFMLPSILAGVIVFNQEPVLCDTGNSLDRLLEASMSLNLLSIIKSCLEPGNLRKIMFIIASILVNRALDIANNCTEDSSYAGSCSSYETATLMVILQLWNTTDDVYLIQSAYQCPESSWSASGNIQKQKQTLMLTHITPGFVKEVHGKAYAIVFHCQRLTYRIERSQLHASADRLAQQWMQATLAALSDAVKENSEVNYDCMM